MNPLTNVRNIQNLNKRELDLGVPFTQSWHQQYRTSAWIFIGGLDYDLTEGDIICLFSQYGEVVNINLIRDQKTGKSKGFAFLCFENQLSTVLSVDNLNSIKLCGRTIRVDHVEEYKVPKMKEDMAPEKIKLALEGCAPTMQPPPQPRAAGHRDVKPPSVKIEENRGYNDRNDIGQPSSGHMVDVKTEPSRPSDDIALPPRLFDIGVKTENGTKAPKKNKDKKKKKKGKKSKKKSKSKKSKKSKGSDSSSSDSDSEDDLESDSRDKNGGRESNSKQRRLDNDRNQLGESSSAHERKDNVKVKEEPRDRGYSSKRESIGRGGGGGDSSVGGWRGRVKEETRSDDSDGSYSREKSKGRGRQVDDRATVSQSRYGNKNDREGDYSGVNNDRKRKWDSEDNRRKSDAYGNNSDNDYYRRSVTTDRSYNNSSRDGTSNRGYEKSYDKAHR